MANWFPGSFWARLRRYHSKPLPSYFTAKQHSHTCTQTLNPRAKNKKQPKRRVFKTLTYAPSGIGKRTCPTILKDFKWWKPSPHYWTSYKDQNSGTSGVIFLSLPFHMDAAIYWLENMFMTCSYTLPFFLSTHRCLSSLPLLIPLCGELLLCCVNV